MKSAIFWILGVGLVVTIVLALPVIVPLVRYLLGSTTLVAQVATLHGRVATSSIPVLLRANVLSRLVIGLIPSFVALLATIGLIGVVSSLRGRPTSTVVYQPAPNAGTGAANPSSALVVAVNGTCPACG
jgi:hypothetical protein